MLKLKLQYLGHLMWSADSLEKTDAGKDWGREEKGATGDEMVEWHHRLNGHGFEQAWGDTVHGAAKSQTWLKQLSTKIYKHEALEV